MTEKGWVRWTAAIAAVVLTLVVAGIAGAYAYLHTRAGLDFLAERIAHAASDEHRTVHIAGLNGSLLSSARIANITVSDKTGPFLQIENIAVDWTLGALLDKTLDIERLSVAHLSMLRLPEYADTGNQPTPLAFSLPLGFRVANAAIAEIVLAQPVLGQAQTISAKASALLAADLSAAGLELSISPARGSAKIVEIDFEFAAAPAKFTANVRIDEPEGGVIGRLAGLPAGERLLVELKGEGPPDAWRGALSLETGIGASIASRVDVSLRGEILAVSLTGTADVAAALPAELHPLLLPHVGFQSEAVFRPAEGLTIKHLTVERPNFRVSASGRYIFEDRNIAAKIAIGSTGDRPLAETFPMIPFGAARIDTEITGTPDAPNIAVDYQVDRLVKEPFRIASLSGTALIARAAGGAFDAKGTLRASGIDTTASVPSGLVGSTLDATIAGTIKSDGTVADLNVRASSGALVVALSGNLDREAEGTVHFSVEHDSIGPLFRTSGLALDGRLHAEGTARGSFGQMAFSATASGALEKLAGDRTLVALTGKSVSFGGAVSWVADNPLEVVGLEVNTAAGKVRADGTVDMEGSRFSGNVDFTAAALAPFSALAGTGLGGSAFLSAAIDGPFDALSARGQARIENLEIEGKPIGQIGIGFTARQARSDAELALRLGGTVLEKALSGSLNANVGRNAVSLSNVEVALGKNRITGSIGLELLKKRVFGEINSTLVSLSDLPDFGAPALAGAATIQLSAGSDAANAVDLVVSAHDIRIAATADGHAAIETVAGRLRLSDPFTEQTFSGDLRLNGASLGSVQGGQASVVFEGTPADAVWDAAGKLAEPHALSITSKGRLSFARNTLLLSVGALEGEIAGEAVRLQAPVRATFAPETWRIEPVDLALAGGRARISAAMTTGRLAASGRLDDLPARLATFADSRIRLRGRVDGTLEMSGAVDRPNLKVSVRARDILPANITQEDIVGFTIALDVTQDTGNAEARFELSGPNETQATASLKTRPIFRSGTVLPEPEAPLSGQIEATGRLELVDSLIGLGEDRLAGHIKANATLAGSFDSPRVNGDARLQEGFYEGVATGSVLRNIEAHVSFTGDSARLESLSADDGAEGRISGKGSVRLSGPTGANGGIEIALMRFTAIRNSLAAAVTSGALTLSGSLETPKLSGALTIENGEIRIPDELPADVVRLEVVEINRLAIGKKAEPAGEPSGSSVYPVELDVGIAIPGRTFVRGRGLVSEWKGDLKVSGTSRDPRISGKLQSVRGTFAFAGRTFVLTSGSVAFPDGAIGEPEITATAEAKLSDIVALVGISGTVSKPSIDVSSVPPLPQEEVLAQILFGKSTGQLSAIQAAQLAQTAATLSGKSSIGIMDKVRQALGVDVLDVETTEGNTTGASLKAGKYVTDDIFLSVTQGTEPGSQKVGAEVQVLPNVTVESNVSGDADSNIGINWKWDY